MCVWGMNSTKTSNLRDLELDDCGSFHARPAENVNCIEKSNSSIIFAGNLDLMYSEF